MATLRGTGPNPTMPFSRFRTALGKPFSASRIGLGRRKEAGFRQPKDLKGGIWPRPRRGLCFGRSESPLPNPCCRKGTVEIFLMRAWNPARML
jgi:hypothetical protein